MLKVKTVYDYRQELCAALRSGKYKLSNRCGYQQDDSHCAIGVAIVELAGCARWTAEEEAARVHAIEVVQSKLGITPWQRYLIECANDEASDENRVAAVCAYLEALP